MDIWLIFQNSGVVGDCPLERRCKAEWIAPSWMESLEKARL